MKVLDFGLAQWEARAVGSEAETILTTPGMVMGTIPYMSPEQARGETVDARSDIFSFGSIYYEMATGRAPFRAASAAALLAAILKDDPTPPDQLRPGLAPRLSEVARRCLQKDPELRYQSAAEIRAELRWLQHGTGTTAAAAAPTWRRWPKWAASAIVITLAALAGYRWLSVGGPPAPSRYSFRPLTFNGEVTDAAIAPDGKFLAYVADTPVGATLHTLAVATGSDVEIVPAGSGCCRAPTFTPDGTRVYFWANGWLEAVPLLGGPVRKITGNTCSGAGFSPDGRRLAYFAPRGDATVLMVAAADGSGDKLLAALPPGAGFSCYNFVTPRGSAPPAWSPDGQHIAAVAFAPEPERGQSPLVAATVGVADGRVTLLPRTRPRRGGVITSLVWSPDGRALLATASSTAASPVQLWQIALPGGRMSQLTEDLSGYTGLSVTAAGSLVTLHATPQYTLAVGAPDDLRPISPDNGSYKSSLNWAAGGQIVFTRNLGGQAQLWIEHADGTSPQPLVADARFAPIEAVAAPDGQIVFSDASGALWRTDLNGAPPTQLAPQSASQPAVGLGGHSVFFYGSPTNGGDQFVARVALAGSAVSKAWSGYLLHDGLAMAPDGHRLFAVSRAPGTHLHAPVILDFASAPPAVTHLPPFFTSESDYGTGQYAWTPDGRAISYVRRQGLVDNLWAMPVGGGAPRALTHFTRLQIAGYAWSPRGLLALSRGRNNTDAVLATPLR